MPPADCASPLRAPSTHTRRPMTCVQAVSIRPWPCHSQSRLASRATFAACSATVLNSRLSHSTKG
eukprot:5014082-Pyramimonas_sp.AAC.1